MATSFGDKLVDRLKEFADALEDKQEITAKFTCRKVRLNLQPTPYSPERVKKVREIMRMSQGLFAQFLGVSVKTVSAWEQGKNPPNDMACRFMDEIMHDPERWRQRMSQLISSGGKAVSGAS